jgi:hypothetical protein
MVKHDGTTHCTRCGIAVRRHSESYRDGTRLYGGHGLCSTCVSRDRTGARPKTEVPSHCLRCEWPLRTRSAPPEGVTRPHHGRGLCKICYRTDQRREARREAAWIEALGLTQNDDTEGPVT